MLTIMTPHDEAGAIIAHYLRQLTQAAGLRWTEHNDHDMRRLAALLADDDRGTITPFYQPAASPKQPVEPPTPEPRQLDTRVTTILEQPAGRERASADDLDDDLDDPGYQQWRAQREPRQRDTEEILRMLRREARREA
jgi:hypothetical protein